MSKERDWMDYAQLGLSATQAYKLSEIASELGELRKASENQERKARRLSQMRLGVVMAEELLDGLESDSSVTETPLQKQFVLIHDVEKSLKVGGVVPPLGFELWDDLDRAKKLGKRLDAFRDRLLKAMPVDQRRDAELCLKYIAEEPELRQSIRLCVDQEAVQAARQKLERLKSEKKAVREKLASLPKGFIIIYRNVTGAIAITGMVVSCGIMCFAFKNLIADEGGFNMNNFLSRCLTGIGVGLGICIVGFLLWRLCKKLSPESYPKLKAELRELNKSELEAKFQLMKERANRKPVGYKTEQELATKSSDKLRTMYIERRDFVRGIVGPTYLDRSDEQEEE